MASWLHCTYVIRLILLPLLFPYFSPFLQAQTLCNGYAELCNRTYNTVSYVTTHNAYSVGSSPACNQDRSILTQLTDGVRAFMLDVHPIDPGNINEPLYLCHTSCALFSAGLLVDTLTQMKMWLDGNPNEVITIFFENDGPFPATSFVQPFTQSGMVNLTYYKQPSDPWPTLQQMIDMNSRVFVVQDQLDRDPTVPWLLHEYDFIWETPFEVPPGGPYICTIDRPKSDVPQSYPLNVVNHFVSATFVLGGTSISVPDYTDSITANQIPLETHAYSCKAQYGIASYIAVDFYEYGDVFQTVAVLNGVTYNGSVSVKSGAGRSRGGELKKEVKVWWEWRLGFVVAVSLGSWYSF